MNETVAEIVKHVLRIRSAHHAIQAEKFDEIAASIAREWDGAPKPLFRDSYNTILTNFLEPKIRAAERFHRT